MAAFVLNVSVIFSLDYRRFPAFFTADMYFLFFGFVKVNNPSSPFYLDVRAAHKTNDVVAFVALASHNLKNGAFHSVCRVIR